MTHEKTYETLIVWLRRDLRLHDNSALQAACRQARQVIPLFVFDDTLLQRDDIAPARVGFLLEALRALDSQLREQGGRLILRRGEPVDQVLRLVAETGAAGVYVQREYEPYGRARDVKAARALQEAGKLFQEFSGLALFEPEQIQTLTGTPYTVFGPFKKVWFSLPADAPASAPGQAPVPDKIRSAPFPDLGDLGGQTSQRFECGGEPAARSLLRSFLAHKAAAYPSRRDLLADEGTSRLSRHLHLGTLGVRTVVAAARQAGPSAGITAFLTELAWRDFYLHILWHFPHVAEGAFKPKFDAIPWENDPHLFEAWKQGQTGYPIVDAAMRQLQAEAWMHNRGRMIVASFLTKDLLIDWRWGERYFMQRLVDGDQAANNGGWQWAAGTGTDPQPFFRIFNPTLQGKKFDPDGAYIRRWVPELARVPAKHLHEPWRLSPAERRAVGSDAYPDPIVDHAAQRARALTLYQNL